MNNKQSGRLATWSLSLSGAVLVVSGLFHLPLFVFNSTWQFSSNRSDFNAQPVSNEQIEGVADLLQAKVESKQPVATQLRKKEKWRKPMLFGISTGMTLLSLAWVASLLKRSRFLTIVSVVCAAALFIEVALITLQGWRGVESHFNRATTFDSVVDNAMLVLIAIAMAAVIYFTERVFRVPVGAGMDQRLAIRVGLLFLCLSCLIGGLISLYGYQQLAIGKPPSLFGQAGVPKFPHGATIHALQLLPLVAAFAKKMNYSEPDRVRIVSAWGGSMGVFLVYSIQQTWRGLGRFEFSFLGYLLLCTSFGFVVWAYLNPWWQRNKLAANGKLAD